MPGWEDALAAVGGAAAGYVGERDQRDKDKLEQQKLKQQADIAQMRADVQAMLEQIRQEGQDTRHVTASGSVLAQQEGATTRTGMTTATTQRGQDINMNLGTLRDATTRRGQDTTATTARRGQDVTAGTARRGQDLGDTHYWDESQRLYKGMIMGDDRARTRDAVDAYGHVVTAGRANSSGLGLDDAKPIPDFKDWMSGSRSIFAPRTPAPAMPPPAAAPPAAPSRGTGAPPLQRPQAAAPAAAPGASRYKVGQTVKLRNGQTVTIKSINPDGTFTY